MQGRIRSTRALAWEPLLLLSMCHNGNDRKATPSLVPWQIASKLHCSQYTELVVGHGHNIVLLLDHIIHTYSGKVWSGHARLATIPDLL